MCLEVTQCLVSTCSNESPRLQILIPPHLDDDTREAVFLCAAHLKISPTKYDLMRQCRGLEIASSEAPREALCKETRTCPFLQDSKKRRCLQAPSSAPEQPCHDGEAPDYPPSSVPEKPCHDGEAPDYPPSVTEVTSILMKEVSGADTDHSKIKVVEMTETYNKQPEQLLLGTLTKRPKPMIQNKLAQVFRKESASFDSRMQPPLPSPCSSSYMAVKTEVVEETVKASENETPDEPPSVTEVSGKKALAADIVHTNDQKEELIELTEMCKQPEQFLCETFLKPMTQNEPVQNQQLISPQLNWGLNNFDHCRLIQNKLILLLHARICQKKELTSRVTKCGIKKCDEMKEMLGHMKQCDRGKDCDVKQCTSTHKIIIHWQNCSSSTCPVCRPIRLSRNISTVDGTLVFSSASIQPNQRLLGVNGDSAVGPGAGFGDGGPLASGSSPHNTGVFQKPQQTQQRREQQEQQPSLSKGSWAARLTDTNRKTVVLKLVYSLCPSVKHNTNPVRDKRYLALHQLAEKMEKRVYNSATSFDEYHKLLRERVLKIQKVIDNR